MFDWLKKIRKSRSMKKVDIKETKTSAPKNISEITVNAALIRKYIKYKQIKQLPYNQLYYSNVVIPYNDKKYAIGVRLSSVMSYMCYLHITEIKIVPKNRIVYMKDLHYLEKCKFMLEKLPEVETALCEIRERLNKKAIDDATRKECEQKCIEKLMEKIQ